MKYKLRVGIAACVRPHYIKIEPLLKELKKSIFLDPKFIIIDQHYDTSLVNHFCRPINFDKIIRTRHIVDSFNRIQHLSTELSFLDLDIAVVIGDTRSSYEFATACKLIGLRIAHIEAGLRSFDKNTPEEFYRKEIDLISDYFFCSEPAAIYNLYSENITNNVFEVGSLTIDSINHNNSNIFRQNRKLILTTLHRFENLNDLDAINYYYELLHYFNKKEFDIIFPIHPNTLKIFNENNVLRKFSLISKIIPPIAHDIFTKIAKNSYAILTDSGGIQEEASIFGIPCFTFREKTERPITVTDGTNILSYKKPINIHNIKRKKIQYRYWDGNTSNRITKILEKIL